VEPWHEVVASLEVDARRGTFLRPVPAGSATVVWADPAATPPIAEASPVEVGDRSARDPLTGLACRAAILSLLQGVLDIPVESAPFAVALIDLDGFRATNQALGYAAGDRLLHAAARRLETCLRRGDTLVRFGSDEFAILLADVQPADAARIGDRLRPRSAPIDLGGPSCARRPAWASWCARPSRAPEDVIRDAERALDAPAPPGRADPRCSTPRSTRGPRRSASSRPRCAVPSIPKTSALITSRWCRSRAAR
jgi:GGDEF domain-containing protein